MQVVVGSERLLGERHVNFRGQTVQFSSRQSVGNSSTKRELHFVSVDHEPCQLICWMNYVALKPKLQKKSENSVESIDESYFSH